MNAVIQVRGLSKSYHGRPAICGLTFEVQRGEVFGLLGANGAGKSTSIECILGTRQADSGTASVLGMDPISGRRQLFQKAGVQFQESSYPDKIRVGELCEETMSLYREPEDYKKLLRQFGLEEKSHSPVSDLSGGQRQRLFIVLALIPGPEVVFLDELTTGLDVKARREVWRYLEHLKKEGMTILLTSHFMDEVNALCDRVAILKRGRTVFCGTVQEAVDDSPYCTLEEAYLWFTEEEENENI